MNEREYLAALQDIRTRRSETIRIVKSHMEWLWWSREPLGMTDSLNMGEIKAIADNLLTLQSAPVASTSLSPTKQTHGGAGPATLRPALQLGIPSPAIPLPIRLTTTVGTST